MTVWTELGQAVVVGVFLGAACGGPQAAPSDGGGDRGPGQPDASTDGSSACAKVGGVCIPSGQTCPVEVIRSAARPCYDGTKASASLLCCSDLDGGQQGDGQTDAVGPPSPCAGCVVIAVAESPASLALSPMDVYFTQAKFSGGHVELGTGQVVQAPRKPIGAAVTLADYNNWPRVVRYAGRWLAWSDQAGPGPGQSSVDILSLDVLGSSLAPGTKQNGAYGVAIDSTQVYWVSNDSAGHVVVQSATLFTAAPLTLGTTASVLTPLGMAVTPTSIYFVAYAAKGGGGLYQLPIAGGAPEAVWTAPPLTGHPFDVALDGTNVYWTDYGTGTAADGAVYVAPLAGGTPTTIASAVLAPGDIAVDSTNVYFTSSQGNAVYEVPIGSTHPKVLVAVPTPGAVAADDNDGSVYFATPRQIVAHPK